MSIKEIAKAVGTSVSTVSRVLNNENYKCRDKELEEKIWHYANKFNYSLNISARNLRKNIQESQELFSVDIYLTRFESVRQDAFFDELFQILKKKFLEFGCTLGKTLNASDVMTLGQDTAEFNVPYKKTVAQNEKIAVVEEKENSGLIILGKCPQNLISLLKKRYKYIAGIDRNPTDYEYDEVICNGTTAAEKAMNHLLSLGHTDIAYIGDCTYESRYIGYYQTLLNHRIPLNHSNIHPTDQTMEGGFQAMINIINSKQRPTAVFCANDTTALGVLKALNKNKRKKYYPSVISIDNIIESEKTSPMLTTINIPKEEMVHMALTLLTDRKKGRHRENVRIELPCRLIERESCYLP